MDRGFETALVGVEEVHGVGFPHVWTVEIGCGAEDDDAGEVGEVVDGAAEEGFEGGVVFLRGGAVGSAAVGEEGGGVFEGFGEEDAREVDV